MFVRNVCGFFGNVVLPAYARSFRKSVARAARPPALRIAVDVGFGTVLSPRANWNTIGAVMCSAYATGLAAFCAHSVLSSSAWIAEAPGTVSITGGRFRSGSFSSKLVKNGTFGGLL